MARDSCTVCYGATLRTRSPSCSAPHAAPQSPVRSLPSSPSSTHCSTRPPPQACVLRMRRHSSSRLWATPPPPTVEAPSSNRLSPTHERAPFAIPSSEHHHSLWQKRKMITRESSVTLHPGAVARVMPGSGKCRDWGPRRVGTAPAAAAIDGTQRSAALHSPRSLTAGTSAGRTAG